MSATASVSAGMRPKWWNVSTSRVMCRIVRRRKRRRPCRDPRIVRRCATSRARTSDASSVRCSCRLDRSRGPVQNGARMRVLFASGIDGFCHRYAVLHWAEQLATQAVPSTVRAHTDPRLAADLATHDVLVLYRVPDGAWVRHLLAHARALGVATVFAVDDLIFEPALADPPPVRAMDPTERRLWHDGVERYRRTLLACDAFLTTTAPLAAAGRDLGRPTYLHRCGLAERELALGAAARRARDEADRGRANRRGVRLGYFSGTGTHDEDFASIAPVLRTVLARHSALTLAIVGQLTLDPTLAGYGGRIEHA